METEKKRWLSSLKIFALLLVAYVHFVWVATNYTTLNGFRPLTVPMLPPDTHNLWRIEDFFLRHFGIDSGLGVVLFFFAAGYMIPHMQAKYNQIYTSPSIGGGQILPHLLFARLKKFYPTLFVCCIIGAVVDYFSSGLVYTAADYIGTVLLVGKLIPITVTMGVTWFMEVLVFVYFIGTVIPKFTLQNLSLIYFVLGLLSQMPKLFEGKPGEWFAWNLEMLSIYSFIPLFGVAAKLAEEIDSKIERVIILGYYLCLTMIGTHIGELCYDLKNSYTNKNTYLAMVLVVIVVYQVDHWIKKDCNWLNRIIHGISRYSFTFYLLHYPVGMSTIYYLRQLNCNSYFCVLAAMVASSMAAYVAEHMVRLITKRKWYKRLGATWQ